MTSVWSETNRQTLFPVSGQMAVCAVRFSWWCTFGGGEKRCNLQLKWHLKGRKNGCLYTMPPFVPLQVNQANSLFSSKTWKPAFSQWEVKRASRQPIEKQETPRCSGCELPLKPFQLSAFVVPLSFTRLPLFLSPALLFPTQAAHPRYFHRFQDKSVEKIISSQLCCNWFYSTAVCLATRDLCDCSAAGCNHHTHTGWKKGTDWYNPSSSQLQSGARLLSGLKLEFNYPCEQNNLLLKQEAARIYDMLLQALTSVFVVLFSWVYLPFFSDKT